jgi:NitT/TauT family transport system substrate-binding protein
MRRSGPAGLPGILLLVLLVGACGPAATEPARGAPAAAAAQPAPGGGAATPERPKESFTFAIPSRSVNYIVPMAAAALGFFDEAGLDVEIQPMQSNLTVAALQRGDLQISGSGGSALRAAMQGAPFKLISFMTVRPTFYLLTTPEIRTAAQLPGKRIGVNNVGSSQQNFVEIYAREQGLDPGQITFIGMGPNPPQFLAAMHAGALDGGVLDPASVAVGEVQGFYTLKWLGEVAPEPLQGLVTTDDYIQRNPAAIQSFLKALVRGLLYAKQNPREIAALALRELGHEVDEATALRGVQLYLDAVSAEAPGYADEKGMEAFYEYDIRIPLQLPPEQPLPVLHDFRFLLAAYDELGIPRPR